MIKSLLSIPFSKYISLKNSLWKKNPEKYQKKVFNELINKAEKTQFGKDHCFSKIKNYSDFKKNVPIRNYEDFEKYIKKIKNGEKDVLWPGLPIYFCKTSGTTSGTKYIPITKESMVFHLKSARDAILSYISKTKDVSIVKGKMIFIQGSPKLEKTGDILTGRLSGIVAHHIPKYLMKNRLPSLETNSIVDWEKKIDAIVDETIKENMTLISGIPPWVQMYFEKLKQVSGKKIKDLFPNFNLFIYGGVNYTPYKETFEKLIGKKINGLELYPASEGFIAYEDYSEPDGMLLCLNHGIFYEFIPVDEFFNKKPKRFSLSEIEVGVNYVIILNTNAGLWGYNIGDTVKFICKNPYKLKVTGRIKHFTSAFGEHVIAEEVEKSLKNSIEYINNSIIDFHVSPQVNPKKGLPYHEWFIEFDENVNFEKLERFRLVLDEHLQKLNPYYKDLISGKVLSKLKITLLKKNAFRDYMKSIGKLGGQNKVPRLSNDRIIADRLIKYKL